MLETIKRSTGANARPLLLTGGSVISMNTMIGDWEQADVLIVGDVIVGVGPGLVTAAEDDNAIVIDCKGMVVLPAKLDFSLSESMGSLTPGNPADIAVIRIVEKQKLPGAAAGARGSHLEILIRQGKVDVWDGELLKDDSHVGMWIDEKDFLRQELLPNGRYDEARGDRPSAYQGQYWITGSRILYLDDLGFWAFGEFKDGILYHAGYRLRRDESSVKQ